MTKFLFYTTLENDMVYPYLINNHLDAEYITDFGILSRVSRDNLNQIIVLHSEDDAHLKSAAVTLKRFSPSCVLIGLFDCLDSDLNIPELLDVGFFDVFKYPYDVDAVVAYIRCRIKSLEPRIIESQSARMQLANAVFNPLEHIIVSANGSFESLTVMQTKVLQILLANGSNVTTRASMMRAIWGTVDFYKSRSLDSTITQLRKILVKYDIQIETVRGLGFFISEIKTYE